MLSIWNTELSKTCHILVQDVISTNFIVSSYACSISFETESVIVTGGWCSGYEKKVTKYIWNPTLGSSSEDWPQLLEARAYHACGKYVDSNNKNVIFQKVVIWTNLCIGASGIWRYPRSQL